MDDGLDERVRAAARAHEALVAAEVVDGLEFRVRARMARSDDHMQDLPEDGMISESTGERDRDAAQPAGGGPGAEESGLYDLRQLAHTTKMRIRRITAEHDVVDDALLASASGLRAVALPEPAKLMALPPLATFPTEAERRIPEDGDASDVAPLGSGRAAGRRYAAIGGGLVAVAMAAFVLTRGGGTSVPKDEPPTAEPTIAAAPAGGAEPGPGKVPEAAKAALPDAPIAASPPTAAAAETVRAEAVRPTEPRAPRPAGDAKSATGGRADGVAKTSGEPDSKRAPGAKAEPAAVKPDPLATDKRGGDKAVTKADAGSKSLEALLDEAAGGPSKPSSPSAGDAPKGPEKTGLDGKDIKAGMGAVSARAQACHDEHGAVGHVKVRATVDPSGKVTKAEATGEFAGTPTGNCVAAAARTASFPAWSGAPMTITYGFTIQE